MHYLRSITKLPKKSVHLSQFYINHLNRLNIWLATDQRPLVLELRTLPLSYSELWSGHKLSPPFFVSGWREFKDYVHYKTIISQNVLLEVQFKNFFILWKSYVPFSRYSVFVFLTISWFTKSVKSWWVLVLEIECIFKYIFWTTTHSVTILDQLIDINKGNTFQKSFEQFEGLGLSSRAFSI